MKRYELALLRSGPDHLGIEKILAVYISELYLRIWNPLPLVEWLIILSTTGVSILLVLS